MNKLKQSVDDLLQDLCLKSGKNNNDHYVKEEQHLEDLNDSAYDQIGHLDDDVSVDDKYQYENLDVDIVDKQDDLEEQGTGANDDRKASYGEQKRSNGDSSHNKINKHRSFSNEFIKEEIREQLGKKFKKGKQVQQTTKNP